MTATRSRPSRSDDDRLVLPRPRRRRWPWVLAVGLLLAALAGGWYVLTQTAVFAVKTVTVVGAKGPLATTVKRAADTAVGNPLFTVDTDAVQAKVVAVPEVRSASVTRSWPNTLTVTVEPRVAVAVTQANDAWWLLDEQGNPYVSRKDKPASLLALELAHPGPTDPATLAGVAVVAALPASVRKLVATVAVPSPYAVTLKLTDHRSVIWGDVSQTALKAKVLPALLTRPGTVFDLSDPTLASVK